MSNRGGGGEILGLLIVLGVGIYILMIVALIMVYAVLAVMAFAAFIAFAWSLVCLLGTQGDLQIGRIYVAEHDAKAFLARGVFGALAVPAFLALVQFGTDLVIPWEYTFYFMASGYTLFSLGVEYLMIRAGSMPYVANESSMVTYQAQPRQELLPPPPSQPRFASWDDEEELGR